MNLSRISEIGWQAKTIRECRLETGIGELLKYLETRRMQLNRVERWT